MTPPRQIAMLIFPEVMSLDVVGPLQVFSSANDELDRRGLSPAYRLCLLGDAPGPVRTSAGIQLCAEACWSGYDVAAIDTLLLPGGAGVDSMRQRPDLLEWLRRVESTTPRLGSVCSGALLLAASGLLDGRLATTHWSRQGELAAFAEVRVATNRLHTYDPTDLDGDSHIFTSAGVTAGIDLALALVEADLGQALALAVARQLVVFLRRPGNQDQFSACLMPEVAPTSRLRDLLEWIPANLAKPLSLEMLAERVHMAPRTLSRLFVRDVGLTPARYVERVRVEAARALLEGGQVGVATAAKLSGLGHPETLRRAFQRQLSVSPADYAQRFTAAAGQ